MVSHSIFRMYIVKGYFHIPESGHADNQYHIVSIVLFTFFLNVVALFLKAVYVRL